MNENLKWYKLNGYYLPVYSYKPVDPYARWEAIGGAVCLFIITFVLWMCG